MFFLDDREGPADLKDGVQQFLLGRFGAPGKPVEAADQLGDDLQLRGRDGAGKENGKVYFDGYTKTNGVVGSLYLPAPKKSLSQSPQEKPPYAQYDITVTHPRFQKRQYLGVPVFSGVESIQNIQLLPLGSDETDNADVTESEPNELLMKGGENNA